jgi:ribulose 1,5-bisphosphate synthetase/thiazole synthase
VKPRIPSSFAFDVAVVGGGSAGFAAARITAGAGLRTVMVEGGRELGGLCILRGCMPSKALLWAAEDEPLSQLWVAQVHAMNHLAHQQLPRPRRPDRAAAGRRRWLASRRMNT